ncbi:MAG: efflux RND transporter permease subunit, partial [bacterium]
MNLIRFIIHRKTLVSMLFIGLTLLGVISYKNLPVELYPNAELPLMIVNISSQIEVDPSYMENQAVIPLEGAVGTLEGIDKIESYAEQRRGTIYVYYTQSTNIKHAYLKLQEKVDLIRSSIPEEFSVSVLKIDTEQMANQFMGLQVRGSGGVDRVRNIVDQKIVRALENIDGVANVEVFGGRQQTVEIILDEDACRSFGITASQIRSLIRQNNRIKTFLGQVTENSRRIFVNLTAEYTDLRDLENIVVRSRGPVLLKDVAEVLVGVKKESSISRVNGKDAVTVQLVRDAQVNLIALSHTTKDVIGRLNDELRPQDIEIVVQSNTTDDMEKNINLIIQLAAIGGCLAILILWMFLRNLRLVVTIALAIPISIFTAFNFFYAFGITINSLTLVGMALAVGMLLDNSVVVLENIYRHASKKTDIDTAVSQGTKEVWRSILAATLTTVTVFLPFLFSSNFMVKIVGHHIGVSIISTLMVSLVVALLLIPMITHFFLKRRLRSDAATFQMVSQKNRLIQIYTLLLKSCMRYPARTIVGAVVLFFASVFICLALSLNVSREVQSEELNLYVTMPSGATLESTDLVVQDLEQRLENIEEKQDVISKIYEEEAVVTVQLKKEYEKVGDRSIDQIKSNIQGRINNIRAAEVGFEQPVSSSRYRGGSGSNPGARFERLLGIGTQQESVVIKGRDFGRMRNVAEDIQSYLEELSTIQSVRLNISDNRPEVHLLFDMQLLRQYGITLNAISSELGTFQNEFSSGLTFKQGTDEIDITIRGNRSEDEAEKTMDDLRVLPIPGSSESTHELGQLSRIIYSTGMSSINRVNQEKQIEVTYRFLPEVNGSKSFLTAARIEVDELIASLPIPSGIAVEVLHEETDLSEFYFLIGAAFVLIYMILASVFESFLTPVVIMFSIPLAATGSFWALILTGNSLFNANTLTGFLILLGVVVNNGIILVDYTRILRNQGH